MVDRRWWLLGYNDVLQRHMLKGIVLLVKQNNRLRPCYAKQFFLQLAMEQTLRCKLQEKFTCNTPFCYCNCCVASCKKSRTILYFAQRCETSCLRVTSPLQLERSFIRHRCVASCKKLPRVTWPLNVSRNLYQRWILLYGMSGFPSLGNVLQRQQSSSRVYHGCHRVHCLIFYIS